MDYTFPILKTPAALFFEDFDAGGALFYANYARVFDRARSDLLGPQNLNYRGHFKDGTCLVVAEARFKYLKPIFLDDNVIVASQVFAVKRGSLIINQYLLSNLDDNQITNLEESKNILHKSSFKLTCVNWVDKKPIALTEVFKNAFGIPDSLELVSKTQQTLAMPEL